MHRKYVHTRFGIIELISENGVLTQAKSVPQAGCENTCQALENASKALSDYENGISASIEIPVFPKATEFQMKVLKEISRIPFGETASYCEIARRIGHPKASRAVGAALGKNPIWIFIPCHRVTGKNGALTGYAGGLLMKEMLLKHEKDHLAAKSSAICTAFVAAPLRT